MNIAYNTHVRNLGLISLHTFIQIEGPLWDHLSALLKFLLIEFYFKPCFPSYEEQFLVGLQVLTLHFILQLLLEADRAEQYSKSNTVLDTAYHVLHLGKQVSTELTNPKQNNQWDYVMYQTHKQYSQSLSYN